MTTRDSRARLEPALTLPELWTQREAAAALRVSARYLRESSCPRVLLPGNGKKGHPLVRYDPTEVAAWAEQWHTQRRLHADTLTQRAS